LNTGLTLYDPRLIKLISNEVTSLGFLEKRSYFGNYPPLTHQVDLMEYGKNKLVQINHIDNSDEFNAVNMVNNLFKNLH
jgi:hypothetical protein